MDKTGVSMACRWMWRLCPRVILEEPFDLDYSQSERLEFNAPIRRRSAGRFVYTYGSLAIYGKSHFELRMLPNSV